MKSASGSGKKESRDFFLPEAGLPAIEIKGSVFTLTVLRVQSVVPEAIENELEKVLAQGPRFFENAPVVLDLEGIKDQADDLDLSNLLLRLRDCNLFPVGVRHATPAQKQLAAKAGVAVMKGGAIQDLPKSKKDVRASGDTRSDKASAPTDPVTVEPRQTKVVRHTVRSGQQVYAPGGDLILLSAVNAGAEIIADGNIHVYAPLRGRALAGVQGDATARIFCLCMEAELVAVAGHYQIYENQVPEELYRQAAQVYLDDERLVAARLTKGQSSRR